MPILPNGSYKDVLDAVNLYITENNLEEVWIVGRHEVENMRNLTAAQRKYIIGKIEGSYGSLLLSLQRGSRFVCSLDPRIVRYQHFLSSMRYIESLSPGRRQFDLMLRICKTINHCKTKKSPLSILNNESLAERILIILSDSYIKKNIFCRN